MNSRWRPYLMFHAVGLSLVLLFGVYGGVMTFLFPQQDFYHCFIHDVMRLYCPFCGFTRGSQALLHLQLSEAFRLNAAVLIAVAVYAVLDLRAFLLLCRGSTQPLVPGWVLPASIVWFAVYTLIINGLLLLGVDIVGDQLSHWQSLALWRGICGTLLLAAVLGCFVGILYLLYHRHRKQLPFLLVLLLMLVAAFLTVLYFGR